MPPGCFPGVLQARALSYHLIVQRAASWGFIVVQYDLPALALISDVTEVGLS